MKAMIPYQTPQQLWKQLKIFEQRGDLLKQAEILAQAFGEELLPHQLQALLKIAHQNALAYQERHPEPVFSLDQQKNSLQLLHPQQGSLIKELLLPRETGMPPEINWSPYGHIECLLLEVKHNQLKILREYAQLSPLQRTLRLNSSYSYLNINDFQEQMYSLFNRSLVWGQIPLEPTPSLPLDLFVSPKHTVLAVCDRGAGKLHLIQRNPLRLMRTWKIKSKSNKKALSVAFHGDGRRIFTTAFEPGVLFMIDRCIAQKKIPVPTSHILSNLALTPKGDRLILLGIDPESHRPDLLLLDMDYQLQQTVYLEGEAFSSGADARDLLEITPDGRYVVVLVSKNQPTLFTPCLLLIDLEKGQILDRLLLAPDKKPLHLAFLARQLVPPQFRLLPLLLHSQGIHPEQVRQAFGVEQWD